MIQFVIPRKLPSDVADELGGKILHDHTVIDNPEPQLSQRFPSGHFRLALWEKGGAEPAFGFAQVVGGSDGGTLVPTFVRTKGERACREHALFIRSVGHCLVAAAVARSGGSIVIAVEQHELTESLQIDSKVLWSTSLLHEQITEQGELEDFIGSEVPLRFEDMLRAAARKTFCYHCRQPHYAVVDKVRTLCPESLLQEDPYAGEGAERRPFRIYHPL